MMHTFLLRKHYEVEIGAKRWSLILSLAGETVNHYDFEKVLARYTFMKELFMDHLKIARNVDLQKALAAMSIRLGAQL